MNDRARLVVAGVLVASAAGALRAQTPAIPVLQLPAPTAKTTETIGAIFGLKQLPDGRVLVNDARKRRMLIFDSTLTTFTVAIDSTSGSANSYPRGAAPLIPFLGDSMLFADFTSQSLLVIDPNGKVARVTTPPKPSDLTWLSSGFAGTDAKGRLVYRTYEFLMRPPVSVNQMTSTSVSPDSAPIVRADFDTRSVDTIVRYRIPGGTRSTQTRSAAGPPSAMSRTVNPVPWTDDWTLHSDGSIAILRSQDYHLDWIGADGAKSQTPKMPYDWRKLTDEDKQRLTDSTKKYYDSLSTAGSPMVYMTYSSTATGTVRVPIQIEVIPLSEFPDYYPPIRSGALKADFDGNLWILPYTSVAGAGKGLVYDVINRKGELYTRVQVPEGTSIAGFGRGGTVYLMSGDFTKGFFLQKSRIVLKGPAS